MFLPYRKIVSEPLGGAGDLCLALPVLKSVHPPVNCSCSSGSEWNRVWTHK